MGGVILDILALIDLAGGAAKFAAKMPELARIVRSLRGPLKFKRVEGGASAAEELGGARAGEEPDPRPAERDPIPPRPSLDQALKDWRAETGIPKYDANNKVVGGTVGVARSDIPGIDGSTLKGASGGLYRQMGQDWPWGEGSIQLPGQVSYRHAEEDLVNQLDRGLSNAGYDSSVQGNIEMRVDQPVCSTCRQGISSDADLGVLGQFSQRYPNIGMTVSNQQTK